MITNPADLHCCAASATGCRGAGGYMGYAKAHGFSHLEVLDWTSSAGDWAFIVSKDGRRWRVLWQTNNYPRPRFSYEVGALEYIGTAEEVLSEICCAIDEGFPC